MLPGVQYALFSSTVILNCSAETDLERQPKQMSQISCAPLETMPHRLLHWSRTGCGREACAAATTSAEGWRSEVFDPGERGSQRRHGGAGEQGRSLCAVGRRCRNHGPAGL